MNPRQFAEAIDALGGVEVTVKEKMDYEDPWDESGGLEIHFSPGRQHLSGKQAMQYARYRGNDGDIGRVNRQREVITELINKLADPARWPDIYAVLLRKDSLVRTDAGVIEIAAAVKEVIKAGALATETLPGTPRTVNGISYWVTEGPVGELPGAIKTETIVAAVGKGEPAAKAEKTESGQPYNEVELTSSLPKKPIGPTPEEIEAARKKAVSDRMQRLVNATKASLGH